MAAPETIEGERLTKTNLAYLLGLGLVLAVALPGMVGVAAAHYCRGEPGDMTHPDGCDPHNCSNTAATTTGPMLPEPLPPIDWGTDVPPLLPPTDPLTVPMNDAGPLRDATNKVVGEVFGLPTDLGPTPNPGVPGDGAKPWHWHTVKHAASGDTFKHHCSSWGAIASVEDVIPV